MVGMTNGPGKTGYYAKRAYDLAARAMDAVEHTPALVPATSSADGYMTKEYAGKLDGVEAGANAYTHPDSGVTADTYQSVTVDAKGHVTAGTKSTAFMQTLNAQGTNAATVRTLIGAGTGGGDAADVAMTGYVKPVSTSAIAATDSVLDAIGKLEAGAGGGVQVGFIMPYAGTGLAEGWLDCDGSAVSRTMYPDLFAAIGTTWGAGDGSTTFNLPRSEDLVLQGASATNPVGTYLSAGLPNIEGGKEHDIYMMYGSNIAAQDAIGTTYSDGALLSVKGKSGSFTSSASNASFANMEIDASLSNPIYGNSDTVQPPAACVRYMIKAFDGPTPSSAGIDLTQYAQDLARRLTREQTPAFNHKDVITTSGTYTAPVTGWYHFHLIGGGGAGMSGASWASQNIGNFGGGGGGAGGEKDVYKYLTANQSVACIVGAGGAGAARYKIGENGGSTSITVGSDTYTVSGGKAAGTSTGLAAGTDTSGTPGYAFLTMIGGEGGWDGSDPLTRGETGGCGSRSGSNALDAMGGSGGGRGGGLGFLEGSNVSPSTTILNATGYGGGGGGNGSNVTNTSAGSGYQGCIVVEYFDPSLNP